MNKLELCFKCVANLEVLLNQRKKNLLLQAKNIYSITEYYQHLTKHERVLICSLISERMGIYIIDLTANFCALAIDTDDIEWLKKTIILHILEGFSDYRMNYQYLATVDYTLSRKYFDLSFFISDESNYVNDSTYKYMTTFFNRNADFNNYGLAEIQRNGRTCFVNLNSKYVEKHCLRMLETNSFLEKFAYDINAK